MADFWQKGVELNLKGKQLTEYVKFQERILREEREEQRRREERELEEQRRREEREIEQQRQEKEEQRRREEIELEQKRLELEEKRLQYQLELARIQNNQHAPQVISDHMAPTVPAFVDGKDQIDSYLARFERFAESSNWQPQDWSIRLSALLTGQALEVYTRLSNTDAKNYDVLKEALLQCYSFTEKGYRKRFRECRECWPLSDETPKQFVERLSLYLHKWVELSGNNLA